MIQIIYMPVHTAIELVREVYKVIDPPYMAELTIKDLIRAITKHGYVYQGEGRFTKPV